MDFSKFEGVDWKFRCNECDFGCMDEKLLNIHKELRHKKEEIKVI